MASGLSRPLVHELVGRLCALPASNDGPEHSAQWARSAAWVAVEFALRREARSEAEARRIVGILEVAGIRPDGRAIERAARQLARAPADEPASTGRSRCILCGGSKTLSEWRLIWMELTEAGPVRHVVKVDDRTDGCNRIAGLGILDVGAEVYSVVVRCSCVESVAGARVGPRQSD